MGKKIVLVGNPNTGKSVIFNNLTGRYVTVSNYPGTTVEIANGKTRLNDTEFEVIDAPGMYCMLPITEEERVARSVLLEQNPEIIVQVADAKNLERTLHLTLQFIEAELPVILDLNLMDEAKRAGVKINLKLLERELNIPVVATVATENKGMDTLREKIIRYNKQTGRSIRYDEFIEKAISSIQQILQGRYNLSKRAIALLLLQDDPEIKALLEQQKEDIARIKQIVEETKNKYSQPLNYVITLARQKEIGKITRKALGFTIAKVIGFGEKLSRLMMRPITGSLIFLVVLCGIYEFVGVFGAQICVEFLEDTIFEKHINPFVTEIVCKIVPWKLLQELFVHENGIITLGIRYAVAIILPIIITFSLAFSILEDTGYFPRFAMLVDRLFKIIGLSGRAVIPMVLGFGCGTMAVMVTRTLETKRERLIAILLLSLAIPCSAQMGIILALLAGNPAGLWIFAGVIALVYLLVGYLTARIMPGERPSFYMEVPPLRLPRLSNIFAKTYARVWWYLKEVLPLFILASIFIWIGKITGLFELVVKGLSCPVTWIGLPRETSTAFLYGFFRRDYGAAGLYDLKDTGILSGMDIVVAAITITLFIPCIAQFIMVAKERGILTALAIAIFIFPFAFFVGFIINSVLSIIGVK